MTREEVKALFQVIVLAYERVDVLPEKIDLWQSLLGDVDFKNAKEALYEHIKTSKFPPTIAEIRDAAYVPVDKPTDNEIAMEKLHQELVNNGYYSDPATGCRG